MGLDDKATQFLLAARQLGVSFEQVVTIGRQQLYIAEHTLQRRLRTFGLPANDFFATLQGTANPSLSS